MAYMITETGKDARTVKLTAEDIDNGSRTIPTAFIDGAVLAFGLQSPAWPAAEIIKSDDDTLIVKTTNPDENGNIYVMFSNGEINGTGKNKTGKYRLSTSQIGPSVVAAYIIRLFALKEGRAVMNDEGSIGKMIASLKPDDLISEIKAKGQLYGDLYNLSVVIDSEINGHELPKLNTLSKIDKIPDEYMDAIEGKPNSSIDVKANRSEDAEDFSLGVTLEGPLSDCVPQADPTMIISKETKDMCKTGKMIFQLNDMFAYKNFLLLGEAGSGKTSAAKNAARLWGLPYVSFNCSGNTDETSLFGGIFPWTDDLGNCGRFKTINDALASKGFTMDSIFMETEEVARAFGAKDETQESVFEVLVSLVRGTENATKYHFVESVIMQTFEHGGVIELQEPASIKDPSVLTALYNLLEPNSRIVTATGRVVTRHPYCIVIVTSNHEKRELSEAFISRMFKSYRVDLPERSVMIERVKARTGYTNEANLELMCDVITALHDEYREVELTGGSCGMREFENWARVCRMAEASREVVDEKKLKELGVTVVLNKISQDDEDLAQMRMNVWNCKLA